MSSRRRFDPRRYSPIELAAVGVFALVFLAISYVVDVRIILETPNYGDVTAVLGTLWRTILGITTIGSFLLAVYNLRTDSTRSNGPATGFSIRGENHDIDFHIHMSDLDDSGETTNDDEEPDVSSDDESRKSDPRSEEDADLDEP